MCCNHKSQTQLSDGHELNLNSGDRRHGFDPLAGKILGMANHPQYSCLENAMSREEP